jgi:hypothetical protein
MSLRLSQEVKKDLSFPFCVPSQQNTASGSKHYICLPSFAFGLLEQVLFCGRKPDAKQKVAFSPLLLTYFL